MIEINAQETYKNPNIIVLGIGGGGNNALNRMIENNKFPVNYVAVNTDKMVLENSMADNTLAIGEKLTGGYGAGGDPAVGAASAEESAEEIANLVRGSQLVILTGGMGGGTGTGAIPVIAKICQDQKVLTVAVVTKPFSFEGKRKMQLAETGIAKLKDFIDTLLVIPNDKLLEMNESDLDLEDAFLFADSILQSTINAITNIICNCGTVNLDFNDLRTVLTKKGEGHLGFATEKAGGNITKAVETALHSPLLETNLKGASYILINCSGKVNLKELNSAIEHIQEVVGVDTYVMWGTVSPKNGSDCMEVTVIATGINKPQTPAPKPVTILPSPSESLARAHREATAIYRRLQDPISTTKEIEIPPFLQQYKT